MLRPNLQFGNQQGIEIAQWHASCCVCEWTSSVSSKSFCTKVFISQILPVPFQARGATCPLLSATLIGMHAQWEQVQLIPKSDCMANESEIAHYTSAARSTSRFQSKALLYIDRGILFNFSFFVSCCCCSANICKNHEITLSLCLSLFKHIGFFLFSFFLKLNHNAKCCHN